MTEVKILHPALYGDDYFVLSNTLKCDIANLPIKTPATTTNATDNESVLANIKVVVVSVINAYVISLQ